MNKHILILLLSFTLFLNFLKADDLFIEINTGDEKSFLVDWNNSNSKVPLGMPANFVLNDLNNSDHILTDPNNMSKTHSYPHCVDQNDNFVSVGYGTYSSYSDSSALKEEICSYIKKYNNLKLVEEHALDVNATPTIKYAGDNLTTVTLSRKKFSFKGGNNIGGNSVEFSDLNSMIAFFAVQKRLKESGSIKTPDSIVVEDFLNNFNIKSWSFRYPLLSIEEEGWDYLESNISNNPDTNSSQFIATFEYMTNIKELAETIKLDTNQIVSNSFGNNVDGVHISSPVNLSNVICSNDGDILDSSNIIADKFRVGQPIRDSINNFLTVYKLNSAVVNFTSTFVDLKPTEKTVDYNKCSYWVEDYIWGHIYNKNIYAVDGYETNIKKSFFFLNLTRNGKSFGVPPTIVSFNAKGKTADASVLEENLTGSTPPSSPPATIGGAFIPGGSSEGTTANGINNDISTQMATADAVLNTNCDPENYWGILNVFDAKSLSLLNSAYIESSSLNSDYYKSFYTDSIFKKLSDISVNSFGLPGIENFIFHPFNSSSQQFSELNHSTNSISDLELNSPVSVIFQRNGNPDSSCPGMEAGQYFSPYMLATIPMSSKSGTHINPLAEYYTIAGDNSQEHWDSKIVDLLKSVSSLLAEDNFMKAGVVDYNSSPFTSVSNRIINSPFTISYDEDTLGTIGPFGLLFEPISFSLINLKGECSLEGSTCTADYTYSTHSDWNGTAYETHGSSTGTYNGNISFDYSAERCLCVPDGSYLTTDYTGGPNSDIHSTPSTNPDMANDGGNEQRLTAQGFNVCSAISNDLTTKIGSLRYNLDNIYNESDGNFSTLENPEDTFNSGSLGIDEWNETTIGYVEELSGALTNSGHLSAISQYKSSSQETSTNDSNGFEPLVTLIKDDWDNWKCNFGSIVLFLGSTGSSFTGITGENDGVEIEDALSNTMGSVNGQSILNWIKSSAVNESLNSCIQTAVESSSIETEDQAISACTDDLVSSLSLTSSSQFSEIINYMNTAKDIYNNTFVSGKLPAPNNNSYMYYIGEVKADTYNYIDYPDNYLEDIINGYFMPQTQEINSVSENAGFSINYYHLIMEETDLNDLKDSSNSTVSDIDVEDNSFIGTSY